jgi:uncharacterized protein YceH (UPF0502 family)
MLTHAEIRVLGCLVEKALATPNAYPLSEAAVLTACNQSTNRDPVVTYDTNAVRNALRGLRSHGLVREVHRAGERAAKHRHLLEEALELSEADTAVLAVLLLRGPQTAAELRARTERLHAFASVAAVEEVLDALTSHPGGPLAMLQERRPGQKEARWAHLLLDPDAEDGTPAAVPGADGDLAPSAEAAGPRVSLLHLAAEVEALRAEVTALREELAALRSPPAQPESPAV